jgi:hypothetical protein
MFLISLAPCGVPRSLDSLACRMLCDGTRHAPGPSVGPGNDELQRPATPADWTALPMLDRVVATALYAVTAPWLEPRTTSVFVAQLRPTRCPVATVGSEVRVSRKADSFRRSRLREGRPGACLNGALPLISRPLAG